MAWRGRQRNRLALAIGLGSALSWLCCQSAGTAGGFGRWQSRAQQCRLERSPAVGSSGNQARSCHVVRLEQNLEGLLSVRFLADGSGPQDGAEQLLFAGVLERGQRPMRCRPDGRCVPRWPTRLVVATVAATSFDGRGLATTVPRTLLARGDCEVKRAVVRCQARNDSGESWTAEARL
ncbi:MAG: hypothetical protein KFB97_13930 [Cyanobium sp. M30B3]|nr:MAG: hypothetical protein KFB97_13930 [Cyanobium sp. M30B3]